MGAEAHPEWQKAELKERELKRRGVHRPCDWDMAKANSTYEWVELSVKA